MNEVHGGNGSAPATAPEGAFVLEGLTFYVPDVYAPGHVLSEVEAAVLNGTRRDRIAGVFRTKVKKAMEAGAKPPEAEGAAPFVPSEWQDQIAAYAADYQFGTRQPAAPRVEGAGALKVVALDFARGIIKQAIIDKGYKLGDYSNKRITELAAAALEKHPEWMDRAREIMEARKTGAPSILDDLGVAA